ncbi:MAG: glycosyl transferase [Desulfovibrio sp.]|nr:glycosyl transferase [Desulfovibrio sp.]MBI4959585.1 glycosyl transferase [Desulfovibrio sp.]
MLISVVTPTRGDRPLALAQAARSLEAAATHAMDAGLLAPGQVEWLVGFDGCKGLRPAISLPTTFVDFPKSGNFGNLIRERLINLAKGSHLMFLDDDNSLAETSLTSFLPHLDVEFIAARIDVSLAFDISLLPRPGPGEPIRQGNIDPLCLCVSRELVIGRGRGWSGEGGYESDFLNIRRYFQRARSHLFLDDVVGTYDSGRGLDPEGVNPRQARTEADKLKGD